MRNLQGGCKISFVFSWFRISVTSIVFERLKKLSTDLKCHLIKYSTLNPSSFPIPQGQARGILLVCHWIPVPNWQFLKNVCSSVMVLLGQMSMFSSLQMCVYFSGQAQLGDASAAYVEPDSRRRLGHQGPSCCTHDQAQPRSAH